MANNNDQNKPRTQNILEALFVSAVNKLENAGRQVSELKVQLEMNIGEAQIYDDREMLLEKGIIFDWANRPAKDLQQAKQQTNSIRVALINLKRKNFFDNAMIVRPFTVSFTDDNFTVIEKIFTLNDEEYVSEGRLMKNLDQDLQNFYKKLFAN